jgi:hypothetical protein
MLFTLAFSQACRAVEVATGGLLVELRRLPA